MNRVQSAPTGTAPACRAYVICATPRSGSTLLCDLLSATRSAGCPRSYFRAQDVARYARVWGVDDPSTSSDRAFNVRYVAAMKRAATAGTGVFGLRLMWPSVAEAAARLSAALRREVDLATGLDRAFGATRFIHLYRRDTIAQAVSLVRAEQTGLWHVAADGSERQRTAPAAPAVFDGGRIGAAIRALEAEEAEWTRFFDRHAIRPISLSYEALAEAPREALAGMLTALGLDRGAAAGVDVPTMRMADATNADWIDRIARG